MSDTAPPAAPQIEAVLFDLTGVLTSSPWPALTAAAGGDIDFLVGPYHEDTDHPWHRLERGEISLTDAHAAILALGEPEHRVDLFEALGALTRASIRPEMIEVVREARAAGLKTAIITNNVREFGNGWRAMLPLDELFDAVIDSAHVGVRKPDPKIYALALEQLGGVAPENAVFLDDFHGNVAAAERVGIRGILVEDDFRPALVSLRALIDDARRESVVRSGA